MMDNQSRGRLPPLVSAKILKKVMIQWMFQFSQIILFNEFMF